MISDIAFYISLKRNFHGMLPYEKLDTSMNITFMVLSCHENKCKDHFHGLTPREKKNQDMNINSRGI